jgi:hypothetical protein
MQQLHNNRALSRIGRARIGRAIYYFSDLLFGRIPVELLFLLDKFMYHERFTANRNEYLVMRVFPATICTYTLLRAAQPTITRDALWYSNHYE